MKVAATINGADLLLLIPTTSDILLLADGAGVALGASIVAREGNQREHSSQTATESGTLTRAKTQMRQEQKFRSTKSEIRNNFK